MTVYQITSKANKLAGIFANPYLLRNAGDTTIYLGTDSSLSVGTQSLSLTAGSTLNWAGGSELWAITTTGQTGVLEVMQDAGSAFTPGPTNVTAKINDPVQVFGTISLTGSAVDLGTYVNNAVPRSAIIPAYEGGAPTLVDLIIPDSIQTLRISTGSNTNVSTTAIVTFYLWLEWRDTVGTVVYTEAVSGVWGTTAYYTVPKRSNRVSIRACNPSSNAGTPGDPSMDIGCRVVGFTTDLPQSYYSKVLSPIFSSPVLSSIGHSLSLGDGNSGGSYTWSPAGTAYTTISSFMGPAYFVLQNSGGAAATFILRALAPETLSGTQNWSLFRAQSLAAGTTVSANLFLPASPIELLASGPASGVIFSLAQANT